MAFTVTHYTACTRRCVQNVALFCDTPINVITLSPFIAAFAPPVFAELTTAERLHVQTPCTLYRICLKSDTKCGQDEQKSIYSPKHSVDFTALAVKTHSNSKVLREDLLYRILLH